MSKEFRAPLITQEQQDAKDITNAANLIIKLKHPLISEDLKLHADMGIRVKHGAGAYESVYVYDDDSTEGFL